MKRPEMIIFDYGHTLCCEPEWDSVRGNAEVMKYITKNPNGYTLSDVLERVKTVYDGFTGDIRRQFGYDIPAQVSDRLLYDGLGIEHSLTPLERETAFWEGASYGDIMPGADKMLARLSAEGIRTAVISNLIWSGEALKIRLDRLLPENDFEFIMTSSDYLFRKPHRMMFDIALQKGGLDAGEVWYCGDNPQADVEGSSQTGIFPVWYDSTLECEYRDKSKETFPKCEFLHIHEWDELTETLDKLDKE